MPTLRFLLFMVCLIIYEPVFTASRLLSLRTGPSKHALVQKTTVFALGSVKQSKQRTGSWDVVRFMSLLFGMNISN